MEELSDNYLMEISPGVFMKFRHAYVVGGVNEEDIKLIDPHGKTKNEEVKIYNPNLFAFVQELSTQLELLQKELETSGYTKFLLTTKNNLEQAFNTLKEKGGKTALNSLRKNWKRLKNRREILEDGQYLTGLRSKTAKNILGELIKNNKALVQEDLGKGFEILRDKNIEYSQDLNYRTLKMFFESVRVNKIKK